MCTSSITSPTSVKDVKVLILGAESAGKSTFCKHMRHINGEKLDSAEIFHLKNEIRAASIKYLTNIIPEFMESENISAIHEQQCKLFLEGQKFSSNINRKTLDAGLKIWRIPSFQDYLQGLMVSQHSLDGRSMKVLGSFEQCDTADKRKSTA